MPPYSSGLDYYASKERLLVSDYHDGAVRQVDLRRSVHESLLAAHSDGRRRALRIKVDAARSRLWVLDVGDVLVYDAATARLIRRIELPGWIHGPAHYSCLPDLALDRSGAALVSSNALATLWRIDPVSLEATALEIGVDEDRDKDLGFTGLAFSADGATLFAVSAALGSLWRLDIERQRGAKVGLSSPVWGACAIAALPSNRDTERRGNIALLVPGGFRSGVYRIDVSPDLRRGEVTKLFSANAAVVRTGVVMVGDAAYLLSSQLSEHPDFFGEGRPDIAPGLISLLR